MKQFFKNTMTLDEVKSTYRKLAMQYHPDVEGGSEELMAELNNQFEIAFSYAKKFNNVAKETESSSEYTRRFYTQNGWQGSRYNGSLRTKDIAKLVREYVKYCYPTYKFSVSKDSYSHIYIYLMEYPIELTNHDLVKEYMENSHFRFYVPSANTTKQFYECTESEKEEAITYRLEHASSSQHYDTWLNPIIYNVMKDVETYLMSYRYDDSDGMIDYFDTNFYYSMEIGKWDKPAKLVEKVARISPTKETKGAKRLTA